MDTNAPRLLPLVDQMDFTDGLCSSFAVATLQRFPEARLNLAYSEDPRHLAQHDVPLDRPLLIHAFAMLPDGHVIDAQGMRPLNEMLRSFGVKRGYKHHVVEVSIGELAQKIPFSEHTVDDAHGTMEQHGWGPNAPLANDDLGRRWKATRKLQNARGTRPSVVAVNRAESAVLFEAFEAATPIKPSVPTMT